MSDTMQAVSIDRSDLEILFEAAGNPERMFKPGWVEVERRIESLLAADAVAAPAVGATVAWLDARIEEEHRIVSIPRMTATMIALHSGKAAAFRQVRALLTAQPGTHDEEKSS